jgi:DNA mismatch repair protein MutS
LGSFELGRNAAGNVRSSAVADPPVRAPERFESVLFDSGPPAPAAPDGEPAYFADLNLDQVCAAIAIGRDEYELAPLFRARLHDPAAVEYRHEVVRDLERAEIRDAVYAFAAGMRETRRRLELAGRLRDRHQRERWFIAAVRAYCDAVGALAADLRERQPASRGLRGLLGHLREYLGSPAFRELEQETSGLEHELAEVRYTVLIKGLRVTVKPYEDELSLSDEVEQTFAKFRQGAVKDHRVSFASRIDNDPVEERVLALVAELHPDLFARVAAYVTRRRPQLVDPAVARFDREVQLYLAYLEYVAPLKAQGLAFCYPAVSNTSKRTRALASFDLALAKKLCELGRTVVCNDLALDGRERLIVVTGPNQGGKTTFARMFGQLHHLAAVGLPVPGTEVELFLPEELFTHFEREEDLASLRGKFEDELVRLHAITRQASRSSVLVMNESFSSTTLRDALWVGRRVLGWVIEQDLLCVCVTFIDELASLGETVVSMMSTVDAQDATQRTFKVVRKPADGLAYATALAEKHGVSYPQLKRRLGG